MNTAEELPLDSDSSDEDYIPDKQPQEVVSEVESDGDPEDETSDNEGVKKNRKRTKNNRKPKKKQRKIEEEPVAAPSDKPKDLSEEAKKKQADDIWADFMKDTGFQSKKSGCERTPTSKSHSTPAKASDTLKKPPEKVRITQVFEFAGEEVAVEKEVAADSAEARLLGKVTTESTSSKSRSKGLGGIGSVLSQLGKKPKISTLEKSKLDWDKFKREENLEEELQTHNKGKDGYLERQDFLQRADLRRFEIEKEIRTIERNKRMNNSI